MRELHVIALSEDGRSVLLAPSKKAASAFRVKLDDKLSAALRGELAREGETGPRPVDVSPKDIQARMRAGESAQEIADAAGVPVARVERFAGPVLSERERIIDQARAAVLNRGRLGPSQLPLGDAVQAALAETDSLKPETVAWSARRLDSGHWLVQVSYVARARAKTASWVLDPGTRAVTASDPASSALGHRSDVPPQGTAAAVAAAAKATGSAAPPRRAAKKTSARRAATTRPAKRSGTPTAANQAASAPAKAAPSKRAAARAAPVAKAPPKVAKAAPTKASKANKAAAKKVAATRASKARAAKKAATRAVPAKQAAPVKVTAPPALRVVPPPPVEPEIEHAPRRRAAGERAQVPAWADVLLGISPRDDKADG